MHRRLIGVVVALVAIGIAAAALTLHGPRTRAVQMSVSGNRVVVRTATPAVVYLEYGRTPSYGLFTRPVGPALVHRFSPAQLAPGGRYGVRAVATASGRTSTADAVLTAVARPARASLQIVADHLELDGRPWIPRFVWGSCSSQYAAEAAVGINAFMSSNCGDTPQLQDVTAARVGGVVIPSIERADAQLPATVATYVRDEPDLTHVSPASLARAAAAYPAALGLPVFETLSRYAYFREESPSRSLYTAYAALAACLGIDVYPILKTGDPTRIGDVAAAQRILVGLAGGKPTFQWIEATGNGGDAAFRPSPREIEAEVWLALTNGARALGYWTFGATPFSVDAPTRRALRNLDSTLDTLAPAIDAAPVHLELADTALDAYATRLGDALYVFAVNPSSLQPVNETFTLPGLHGRELRVYGSGRTIAPSRDTFADSLAPLAWRVYLVAPS